MRLLAGRVCIGLVGVVGCVVLVRRTAVIGLGGWSRIGLFGLWWCGWWRRKSPRRRRLIQRQFAPARPGRNQAGRLADRAGDVDRSSRCLRLRRHVHAVSAAGLLNVVCPYWAPSAIGIELLHAGRRSGLWWRNGRWRPVLPVWRWFRWRSPLRCSGPYRAVAGVAPAARH